MAGRLVVITGPMWAGKSTELIRRLREAEARGLPVQAFRPARDTRHDGGYLLSHDGHRAPARCVRRPAEIRRELRPGTRVVGIDEVHMLPEGLVELCGELVERGFTVLASGLDTDHRGRPFAPLPELLCLADAVEKKVGRCARCPEEARYSQRLVRSDARILPGGAGLYEPRCRGCFEMPEPRAMAI